MKAQYWQESHLDPAARSGTGAEGIAQFMEPTWQEAIGALGWPKTLSRRDAAYAIEGGAWYMARLRETWQAQERAPLDKHDLALASYNAGTGSILKAQKSCGDAVLWPDIAPCLSRIVGAVEKPLSEGKLLPLILRHFGQSLIPPRPQTKSMPVGEIREAILEGQFEPFFQPKVFMHNCKLAGVEALMRWRHPKLGIIQPGAFIPVMEANGLISEVTFTLVEKALADCAEWHKQGLDTSVAFNLSVDSLRDTTLPDKLSRMAAAAGLHPESFTIEVTETVAMTDLGHSLETLARLRMKGFGLSIDDYGTGFSSMQQLTRVPFSELKIDQIFVTGAAKQDVLQALLGTSVTMAQRLKLRSVAEGVETEQDWQVVARLGCDVAQGYFIGKPMPANELVTWYNTWMGTHESVAGE